MIKPLYETCPAYRRLVDELFKTQQEIGALRAAYQNAINDRLRIQEEVHFMIEEFRKRVRDDPGRNGSGKKPEDVSE